MAEPSQNQPQDSSKDLPKVRSGSETVGSNRLPFEPKKRKKKQTVPVTGDSETRSSPGSPKPSASPPKSPGTANLASPKSAKTDQSDRSKRSQSVTLEQTRIPDRVSRRMISRILVFSGIPTFLGISSFFISYLIITQKIMELPNVAVLFTSLGCFGLGVLGLSYGVLSASWEEEEPGTLVGLSEFRVNVQRFLSAWREFRQGKTTQAGDKD
ncbi:MAG: PAM68 family protein [Prochlorotrichaceae cyanobacterium]